MLCEPLGRRLGPDLGNAGYVVGRVADEGEVVDDLLGIDIELRFHAGAVERCIAHRVDERDRFIDELRHVLVARRDEHAMTFARSAAGERGDHVVGFHSLDSQHGQALRAQDREQRLHLRAQIIGHRRAMCLVLAEELITEGLARSIEHHGDARRMLLVHELEQHVEHAQYRARRLAARVAERRQGVESPIQIRRAVDEDEERGAAHGNKSDKHEL